VDIDHGLRWHSAEAVLRLTEGSGGAFVENGIVSHSTRIVADKKRRRSNSSPVQTALSVDVYRMTLLSCTK
jgi:hypothetical protein